MKKYPFLLLFVFLCFTMCQKEDPLDNYCFSDTLLSQVNYGEITVHGLFYNSECHIYESIQPFTYEKFTYNDQNLLTKTEVASTFGASFSCVAFPAESETDPRKARISGYSEFEYDSTLRLIRKMNYFMDNLNPRLLSYQTFDYLNGKIIKASTFNPQDTLTEYKEYTYDATGNLTQEDSYINNSGLKLIKKIVYEFDDKNNPFQVLASEGIPGLYTNPNNILSETTTTYFNTYQDTRTRDNVYEYNSLGFPVKVNGNIYKYGR